jgi:hypothetical protein
LYFIKYLTHFLFYYPVTTTSIFSPGADENITSTLFSDLFVTLALVKSPVVTSHNETVIPEVFKLCVIVFVAFAAGVVNVVVYLLNVVPVPILLI